MIWQVERLVSAASTDLVPSSHNNLNHEIDVLYLILVPSQGCRLRLRTSLGHKNCGEAGRNKALWAEWLIVSWYSTHVGGGLKVISLHEFH